MLKINGSGTINCGTAEKPDVRPVAFTFSCVAEFCQMQGNGSIQVLYTYLTQAASGEVSLMALRDLLYCALKYGYKKAGATFTETPDSVGDLLGEMESDGIVALNEILAQSMPQPKKKEPAPVLPVFPQDREV